MPSRKRQVQKMNKDNQRQRRNVWKLHGVHEDIVLLTLFFCELNINIKDLVMFSSTRTVADPSSVVAFT